MSNRVEDILEREVKQSIDLSTLKKEDALNRYSLMLLIRQAEDCLAELVNSNVVRCPAHLGAGQEAIAVGVCANLCASDYVFGTHRAHAHYLAMGGDLRAFFAEVMGKKTGCSGGIGGSMHLIDQSCGFWGSVPIVGATIPIAAGAALAIKRKKESAVAVCFFGDGAAEEGVFHETMNMAASMKLPLLFVCENNFYSSHLDILHRQPCQSIARFAGASCIRSETVDGNNVVAVQQSAHTMVEHIKRSKEPAFLECTTFRQYGHVGPNKDIDVGVRRSQKDIAFWHELDPIKRLEQALLQEGVPYTQLHSIAEGIEKQINDAVVQAQADPFPAAHELLDHVYVQAQHVEAS